MFLKKNNQPYSPLLIFSLETPQESESSASVTIYVESQEESNTFEPIQNPVNSSDSVEEEVIYEEYWSHSLKEINATSSDDSDAESGNLFLQSKLLSEIMLSDTPDPQNMKTIIAGYISPKHIEVGCARYVKNICVVGIR